MKHPLNPQPCACGCGEMTSGEWRYESNQYVRYVAYHHRRVQPPKHPLRPQLCACGCGEMTNGRWHSEIGGYTRYIAGHQNRGKTWTVDKQGRENMCIAQQRKTLKALEPIIEHCELNGLDMIEFISSEHWDKEKSLKRISEEWGVQRWTLTKWMDRNGVRRRTQSESIKLNWKYPSEAMVTQMRDWQQRGMDWMQTEEGREFMRQRCLENNPADSPEARRKISESKQGEKNAAWNGGTGYLPHPPTFNITLKKKIRGRDNYTCQECGKKGNHVHHIDYDKFNQDPMNLITLCGSCHAATNTTNRDCWTVHYQALMAARFGKQLEFLRIPELTTKPTMGTTPR